MVAEAIDRTVSDAVENASNGAELAIQMLEAHGVETVFGIPGVHTLALYDALRTSSIRHVLARHEQGAGFMADGYARASGRPGVALVITGPGVTNIATPIGQAYTDSSPVLVLSSNNQRDHLDAMRGNLHDLKDQRAVMGAVTKWTGRAMHANEVPTVMRDAFAQLLSGRPLPVHVEFPLDVLDEGATDVSLPQPVRPEPLQPAPQVIADAVSRLQRARRTVIYCGGGAVQAGASDQIVALAELLGAPVVTSIMGKGAIPEDHPLSLGSLWSAENEIDTLMREADCLLVFGSKLGAQATHDFSMPLAPELIRIDVDPHELTLNAQPTLAILGDARLAAQGMVQLLRGSGFRAGDPLPTEQIIAARVDGERTSWHAERRAYVDALRRAIPRDGIVVTDMTQMSYVATGVYPVYEPRTYMFPSGYGTLGFALPAAIGAKVARPEAAVVAVAGDGGFQFTMSELGTAVQERLGIPVVIFNDSCYSAVKENQALTRGNRYLAVDLVNPDYVDLAAAYRIPGVRVESPEALETAIGEALTRDLPTIIDVPIEPWV